MCPWRFLWRFIYTHATRTAPTPEQASEKQQTEEKGDDTQRDEPTYEPPPYKPPLPFPQRFIKANLDKQFMKFLGMLKKLHITIPFTEAITNIPSYAKFMKELLSNRKKLQECATVALNMECSALVQSKLPQKLQDPGSFSIPCTIGKTTFKRALCDLGASVSLMPRSVFDKLGCGDLSPTRISLQLADRSIRYPEGVLLDVPIQVGEFWVPRDLVVIDMDEDDQIPIILGRPFLATCGAMIDVKNGKISLNVGKEKVIFDMNKSMKYPSNVDLCYNIETLEDYDGEEFDEFMDPDALEDDLDESDEEEALIRPTSPHADRTEGRIRDTNRGSESQIEPIPPKLELKPLLYLPTYATSSWARTTHIR